MEERELHTTAEIAHIFKLGQTYLRQLRYIGDGPRYYKLGRKIFYRIHDVEFWLSGAKVEVTPNTKRSNENG